MYALSLHPQVHDQIDGLPDEALGPLAELYAVLDTAPWSGRPYNRDNPRGNMLTLGFGGRGMAVYLVLEEQREVHVLIVRWL